MLQIIKTFQLAMSQVYCHYNQGSDVHYDIFMKIGAGRLTHNKTKYIMYMRSDPTMVMPQWIFFSLGRY